MEMSNVISAINAGDVSMADMVAIERAIRAQKKVRKDELDDFKVSDKKKQAAERKARTDAANANGKLAIDELVDGFETDKKDRFVAPVEITVVDGKEEVTATLVKVTEKSFRAVIIVEDVDVMGNPVQLSKEKTFKFGRFVPAVEVETEIEDFQAVAE